MFFDLYVVRLFSFLVTNIIIFAELGMFCMESFKVTHSIVNM